MDERAHPSMPRTARQLQAKMAAPYTELDIFPARNGVDQKTMKTTRRRRGLASLPIVFTMPSEAVEKASNFTTGGSAANFLDALRSRTLLDLSCMREFSLLRTKPMTERNLSRLSVTSAYNVHSEQLHLQNLVTPPQSARKDDSPRQASPVKQQATKEFAGLSSRIARAHRKILQTAGNQDGHSNQTPRRFVASPPPAKVSPKYRQPQEQTRHSKSVAVQRPRTEPATSLSVTEQHGFLQEQDLAVLMATTGYSRAELFSRWARFKALCSMSKNSHGVDKETLRHGVPQLSVEDQFFVDRAFDVLDADGSGGLDWSEFIAALSALEKGDASRRVYFLFRAYDLNGDDFIQRQEAQSFFLASLLVPQTPQALEVARHFVDKIFISLGREDQDSIRVSDAMKYLQQHPATDAYSILGRTMVSTPPSTPVPLGVRRRRKPIPNERDGGKEA